jgi:hypothetical protein
MEARPPAGSGRGGAASTREGLAAVERVERLAATAGLPTAAVARVRLVCAALREALKRCAAMAAPDAEAYTLIATATGYLPDALEAYLELPAQWAVEQPGQDGRTSLMVLCDSLDLLTVVTRDALGDMIRRDARALVVHDRFLRDRFGRSSLDLGP